jgi:hypothetical protein
MTGEYLTTQMCLQCRALTSRERGRDDQQGSALLPRACAVGSQLSPSSESGQERRDQHLQGQVGISQARTRPGDQYLEEKCLKRDHNMNDSTQCLFTFTRGMQSCCRRFPRRVFRLGQHGCNPYLCILQEPAPPHLWHCGGNSLSLQCNQIRCLTGETNLTPPVKAGGS